MNHTYIESISNNDADDKSKRTSYSKVRFDEPNRWKV